MEQLAEVKEITGQYALLQIKRHTTCKKCGKCQGAEDMKIKIRVDRDLEIGDRILLEMGSAQLLGAAAFIYLFPLLALLLGYFLGSTYLYSFLPWSGELAGALTGVACMGLSFLIIKIYDRRIKVNNTFKPRIKRVYKGS